jgi:Ca2+-transporting ATPase
MKRMLFESATIGAGTMGAFLYGIRRYGPGAAASTLAFNTLTLNELAHAYSSRSGHRNLFGSNPMAPNPHLNRAILGMGALQAAVSVIPAARRLLGTTPLGAGDLLAVAAGVVLPMIVNEATKPPAPAEDVADADFTSDDEEADDSDEEELA